MVSKTSSAKAPGPFVGLCRGRAACLPNLLCMPFVLVWRSIATYCLPCIGVYLNRCGGGLFELLCSCFAKPHSDAEFCGQKALGEGNKFKESDVDWVRAGELAPEEGPPMQLFQGRIEPADLCQGALGDCWLVAGLACAAEFPTTIQKCFKQHEFSRRGRYDVTLFNPRSKKFETVVIDDKIPCRKGTKKPLFLAPHENEAWAMLVEKAFAKLVGSYHALDGGYTSWTWQVLTGDHVSMFKCKEEAWTASSIETALDAKGETTIYTKLRDETYTDDEMWRMLKRYDQRKALIGASFQVAGGGEHAQDDLGLVAGHAYSLIQARVVGSTLGAGGTRLLQLRNPWGTFEWKGAWGDNSSEWDQNPSVAKELKFVKADDGTFWIEWSDFKQHFKKVEVCDRSTDGDLYLNVDEDGGGSGAMLGCIKGCLSYWFCLKGLRVIYFGHKSTEETIDAKKCACMV